MSEEELYPKGIGLSEFVKKTSRTRLDTNSTCGLRGRGASLLREDNGAWRLSDAYDLLPVKLILPEDVEDMALTLNGKKSKINGDDFLAFAKTIGMTDRQTTRAISRITNSLIANLGEVLRSSPLSDEFAARYERLVRTNLNRVIVKF